MKTEDELYDDVLKEEPDYDKPGYKKKHELWARRVYKSIGWVEPVNHDEVILEKSKKNKLGWKLMSSPLSSKIYWDVCEGRSGGFVCEDQEHAEILSLVLQMNERLKRIEALLKKK